MRISAFTFFCGTMCVVWLANKSEEADDLQGREVGILEVTVNQVTHVPFPAIPYS